MGQLRAAFERGVETKSAASPSGSIRNESFARFRLPAERT